MKRIMFLGGSTQQIPAIKYAKKQGYYTILCDYLPDNPGQYVADEFYCTSTTDKEAILNVAQKTNIDGIVAYASDPAAPTAAYVGEKLNLPSNSYESVLTLSKKDLFRKFLKDNGFNCPRANSFTNIYEARQDLKNFKLPIIVKPIDSSGSKGVNRVDSEDEFEKAFNLALENSRDKVIIVEEFIEMSHEYMIGGDGFVVNGKFKFKGLLNCHRNKKINPYIPIGKSYPFFMNDEKIKIIEEEVQRVLDLLNIKMGALNLELMFDKDDKLYIIEIGPRNGGNMIPDLLQLATGVDLIGATVEASIGNYKLNIKNQPNTNFYSTYIIHSGQDGKLKEIAYKNGIKDNIIKTVMYKNIGDDVEKFNGANKAIGILFLKYSSLEELKYKMDNMQEFIEVRVC